MFKLLKRKQIYKDAYLTFYQDNIELPDGTKSTYTWVDRKSGVGIVAMTADKKILLNREYRYVLNAYSWEIPGGGIDRGETPVKAALRELYEETGIRAGKMHKLGAYYPLNSFNTELVTLFYTEVESTKVTSKRSEAGEHMAEQKYVRVKEAKRMIDQGEIQDAMTVVALQTTIKRLLL